MGSFSNHNSAIDSHDILSIVEIAVSEIIGELKNINPTNLNPKLCPA